MKVGIYNRWLHTMGGGERHMGAIAEALAADPANSVELLTDRLVDLTTLGHRLNLDLSRVSLRLLPTSPVRHNYTVQMNASFDYDLFINASHLDLFPAFGRKNVALVYFPSQLPQVGSQRSVLRRAMGPTAAVRLFAGFHGVEQSVGGGLINWTQERAAILLPTSPRDRAEGLVVQLVGTAPRPGGESTIVRFSLNGQPLETEWRVPADNFSVHTLPLPRTIIARSDQALLTLAVDTPFTPSAADQRLLGIALSQINLVRAAGGDYLARLLRRRYAGSPQVWGWQAQNDMRAVAASLDQVWANSQFTAQWIARYWGVQAEVLYPPVDVDSFGPGAKVARVISVGRFFAGSHNKKHDVMVQAFRDLCDAGLRGWEYHLVGNVGDREEDAAYLERVTALAEGYPIYVHCDAPFSDLQALYAGSKLFWHATGYGEDIEASPERFEHFGITTVEAMAAGCVPVVIAAAGQTEIVRQGVDGLLWHDLAELKAMTLGLVADDGLRAKLAVAAVERSQKYDKRHVIDHLHELVAGLEL